MSMPSEWVEALFRRLLGVYGNRFTRMWGDLGEAGVTPEQVKAIWARELGSITPEQIRHALDHLPESSPPTVLEFRRLCLQAPVMAPPALPAPKADPAAVAQAVGRAMAAPAQHDPKGWARRLLARVEAGERLPIAHVQMARQALQFDLRREADDARRVAA